jgi:hypothetical protein
MINNEIKMVDERLQASHQPNISNDIFKLDNFITIALQNTKNKPLTEEDLAKLIGFTDKEILMLKLYWDPCFNKSWLYLSDELILENLTNETSKHALKHFYIKILIPNYEENIDYKEVTIDDEIIKKWWTNLAITNPNYKPASNKKYYIVTGESYKCMLMASRAKKGKETRKYYIKANNIYEKIVNTNDEKEKINLKKELEILKVGYNDVINIKKEGRERIGKK